ncbi:MAG TPA: hypothetical protein VJ852_15085 [Gemmatimonadaceae bacterium]|nr:hypothetical protein [Gemmatimonadaceae bacterium]
MSKLYQNRFVQTVFFTTLIFAAAAACSSESQSATGLVAGTRVSALQASIASTTTYTLSSVTPPIVCTDASGAVTTVTGGTLVLSRNGKFTATFNTQTTASDGTVSAGSVSKSGSYSQSGSVITFQVPGVGTFTGTVDSANGTITIADYPYCGSTHTAVFTLNP